MTQEQAAEEKAAKEKDAKEKDAKAAKEEDVKCDKDGSPMEIHTRKL